MNNQKYVVGFMFDHVMATVALIRKQKPAWQAGLLNGLGGKTEEGETPLEAMVREFHEEAGVFINGWFHFATMRGVNNDSSGFEIEFFYCFGDPSALVAQEAEQIEVVPAETIAAGLERTIGNLPWLVALARDYGRGVHPPTRVTIEYGPETKGGAA